MSLPIKPISGEEIPAGYFTEQWEYLRSTDPQSSATIRAVRSSNGTRFELVRIPAGLTAAGGGSSAYTGPYAITKKDDTNITLILVADNVTYFQSSGIISGLTMQGFSANVDIAISLASSVIYADITYPSSYVTSFVAAASMPSQSEAHLYVPLGKVLFAGGKITSIKQFHEGQIYPTKWGRIGG